MDPMKKKKKRGAACLLEGGCVKMEHGCFITI